MTKRTDIVATACLAVLDRGERPTVRNVADELTRRNGWAPSFRDLAPRVREWKEKHRGRASVRRLVDRYESLDAEERAAFRDQAGLVER